MIGKGLLWGLAFVVIAILFGWIRETMRIVKLQNLLSNEYASFMGYLMTVCAAEREWEFSDTPLPDSMRLVYRSFGVNHTMYLKYSGPLSRGKAIDKLIANYQEQE